jgi:hypothetical protein
LLAGTQRPEVQVLLVHWLAEAQTAPFGVAQVLLVALQSPEVQTAVAAAQVPLCKPSLGMGWPAPKSASQLSALRLQWPEGSQSPSA